jgi:hypothetical protein
MALSMDEERMLAEIERRLADDDPVLAARLTSFRLPRLALAPRSQRGRLTASLLMLVVVAAVSVFVYALMPFRGQNPGGAAHHGSASPRPAVSAAGKGSPSPVIRAASRTTMGPRTGTNSSATKPGPQSSTGGSGT